MGSKKIISEKCEITVNQKIKDTYGTYLLRIKNPFIASNFKPGQFVMVKPNIESFDPLLSRPFSIFNKFNNNEFEVLYRVYGKGTQFLSELRNGDFILATGPLGNGFGTLSPNKNKKQEKILTIAATTAATVATTAAAAAIGNNNDNNNFNVNKSALRNTIYILIAGGIGIAPLFYLPEYIDLNNNLNSNLNNNSQNYKKILYYGSRTENELYFRHSIHSKFDEVYFSTDDGSFGYKGSILDLLSKNIDEYLQKGLDIGFYSCGPRQMLSNLINRMGAALLNFNLQVSLEESFACGIGVCLGCVVKCKKGDGGNKVLIDSAIDNTGGKTVKKSDSNFIYKRVCKDGPVFYADELFDY
jgi:dihydroorotate dehydrogenase electron transfer subunit